MFALAGLPDVGGAIVGTLCIIALRYLYLNCDAFSDGNVGVEE